jgi:hypothetical protein
MDELALLKGFRLEDASTNGAREHARVALRAAVAQQRRSRRRTFVVLAFVGAVILAGAAYAVARELVVGSPAPEEVRAQPARFGHSAELIPVPHPDDPRLEEARVAAVVDSSVGRVYLFASPNARGLCGSTWIEGDRGYQGRLNMSGVCGEGEHQSFYAFGNQPFPGKVVRLFFGRAGNGVARVALRFGSRTIDVPLTGRWFLAQFPEQPDQFLSYDGDGRVLERRSFLWSLPRRQPVKQPHQVTRAREVANIRARQGSEHVGLFVAKASNGGYCQIVRSNRRPSNRGCGMAAPKAHELGVSAMNFGGGPPDVILLLVGPVGSDIATLALLYEDGRVATIPLHDGWTLYEVEPEDYVIGQRPAFLIGRAASGKEIASKRLPWTRR